MADEKQSNGEGKPKGEGAPLDFESADLDTPTGGRKPETDSGFGNLPPLSDFESSDGGAGFDSSLPPLGDLSSDGGIDTPEDTGGGLPPISDLEVETPIPTGGNVKPPPPGFEDTPQLETPVAEGALNTPQEPAPGTSFQDLAADSDFTPETPEVAPPGPETDLETPMFDSAFGGDESGFGAADTSAPTQAMETPMFGAEPSAQGQGFDEDAFGGGFSAPQQANGGTPLPDFSPDTAVSPAPGGSGMEPPSMATPAPRSAKKGGGGGMLIAAALIIVALAVGVVVGPMLGGTIPNPLNPYPNQIADLETKNTRLQGEVDTLTEQLAGQPQGGELDGKTMKELADERTNLIAEIDGLTKDKATATADFEAVDKKLQQANEDVQRQSTILAQKKEEFDVVQNRKEVVQAQEAGLHAEVARLQQQVGKLEVANSRNIVTRETLQSNIEELGIMVREGNPLTPQEFGRDKRIAAVDALRQKATDMPWVSPELLDEYTAQYLRELEIASAQKYFFAKIPVKDRFGVRKMSWAECLMNGNWNTYFRTLDGEHIGIYKNVSTSGAPQFTFVEEALDEMAKANIQQEIFTSRTPGFEGQVKLLAERELALDDKDDMQKVYDSM
jgi:hypothetical protein